MNLLTLDQLDQLRKEDHWELLAEISDELRACAASVKVIADSINLTEVGNARKALSSQLADVGVMVSITRYKLSVMDSEWKKQTEQAAPLIINRITKKNKPKISLEDLI